MAPRLLVIGLDAFERSLAKQLMADGLMPNLAKVAASGTRYRLDQADMFTGLPWEHWSSGRSPADGGRWSAITFDTAHYTARQDETPFRPFLADVPLRTVVLDLPYCDLASAPTVRGLTRWGSHDPGAPVASRPAGLHREIAARFGAYPAAEWIYGFSWPSVTRTRAASAALVKGVHTRAAVAKWLLAERLPDWDLGIVVVSEGHSAIEPMWHGVDPRHPLHGIPSAKDAGDGLRAVYGAIDELIGTMQAAFPDATLAVFTMHGMGANDGDVASMVLLPELLYRHAFGTPHMLPGTWPAHLPDGTPLLSEDESWESAMARLVPLTEPPRRSGLGGLLDRLQRKADPVPDVHAMSWMPSTRYSEFWPRMRAFALPSFNDGRVRLNVRGRESRGMVAADQYRATLDEIAQLLEECREPIGGQKVVAEMKRHSSDPMTVGPSLPDLTIFWRGTPLGLVHPSLGPIGPVPWRRTGAHTGECGFLYMSGDGLPACDAGDASAFDVVPTLIALAGAQPVTGVSGRSLLPSTL